MVTNFDNQVKELRVRTKDIMNHLRVNHRGEKSEITIPEDFKRDFFALVDKVNLSLMEDKDNFYGYFLFQMSREIRLDIGSPTAVNFKGAKYIIYFNPILFLKLNRRQMEASMKHEILHIVSMHLIRARDLGSRYSKLAVNMAMDIVVNKYLTILPPYATTLEGVNAKYALKLEPYQSFEYYAKKLQTAMDLEEEEEDTSIDDTVDKDSKDDKDSKENNDSKDNKNDREDKEDRKNRENKENKDDKDSNNEIDDIDERIETEYSAEKTHDLWEESNDIDEKTLQEFTEKIISNSHKGEIPTYLSNLILALKNTGGELPWNLYLNRLMGTMESNKKKTITRRNRRQPERLDLRGELRDHKANIVVALDISGSISDEEFKQAITEVLSIVKNYSHDITMIECDDVIRHVYKVKSVKDIKDRTNQKGGTKFNPVFEYANHHKVDLLVYFTDGKGEDHLKVIPRGYKVLWVISGRGEKLSLKKPYGAIKKLKYVEIKDDILDITDVPRGGFSMNYQERNV